MAEKWDPRLNKMLYLVNWKGFEEKDYTWEPEEHFHAPETLLEWENYKKTTPMPQRFDWRDWDKTYGDDDSREFEDARCSLSNQGSSPEGQVSMKRDTKACKIARSTSPTRSQASDESFQSISSTDSLAQELTERASPCSPRRSISVTKRSRETLGREKESKVTNTRSPTSKKVSREKETAPMEQNVSESLNYLPI
ncbi:hypothetical protein ABW19_dt0207937 [Dactylella cylindrospora]|nr:hypothetical protein ABW19_dt0207937 [Dactylella cylindrospora]